METDIRAFQPNMLKNTCSLIRMCALHPQEHNITEEYSGFDCMYLKVRIGE